jgi:hypothetical protein
MVLARALWARARTYVHSSWRWIGASAAPTNDAKGDGTARVSDAATRGDVGNEQERDGGKSGDGPRRGQCARMSGMKVQECLYKPDCPPNSPVPLKVQLAIRLCAGAGRAWHWSRAPRHFGRACTVGPCNTSPSSHLRHATARGRVWSWRTSGSSAGGLYSTVPTCLVGGSRSA